MAERGEPEKIKDIDSEYLSGKRQDYQEDIALVEDIDLEAATPGQDINWLEDVELLVEEGTPAVFDRYVLVWAGRFLNTSGKQVKGWPDVATVDDMVIESLGRN